MDSSVPCQHPFTPQCEWTCTEPVTSMITVLRPQAPPVYLHSCQQHFSKAAEAAAGIVEGN